MTSLLASRLCVTSPARHAGSARSCSSAPRAPLEGLASQSATARRASLLPSSPSSSSSSSSSSSALRTPFALSSLGYGAYRASSASEHGASLASALRAGVCVVDTSPAFASGGSERFVGAVLRAHVDEGELTRHDVALVSKALTLAPHALRTSLTTSLERLGVSSLDALLLHAPETHFGANNSDAHDALVAAMTQLEREVAGGRLGCYGVSSSALAGLGASSPLALTSLLRAAESAAHVVHGSRERHHLALLAFPLNLLEAQAFSAKLIAQARAHGLATLAQRPLNAGAGRVLLRLVDEPPVEGVEVAHRLKEAWDYCGYLERLYAELWERDDTRLRLERVRAPSPLALTWAHSLAAQSRALDLYGWREVHAREIWPSVEATCTALAQCEQDVAADKALQLGDLAHNYRRSLRGAFELLEALLKYNRHRELAALRTHVDIPERARLRDVALNFALSSGVDCVLLGMHSSDHVTSALDVLSTRGPLTLEDALAMSTRAREEAERIAVRYESERRKLAAPSVL